MIDDINDVNDVKKRPSRTSEFKFKHFHFFFQVLFYNVS